MEANSGTRHDGKLAKYIYIYCGDLSLFSQPSLVSQRSVCVLTDTVIVFLKDLETAVVLTFVENRQSVWEGKSDFLIVWLSFVIQANSMAARLKQNAIFASLFLFFLQAIKLKCSSAIWIVCLSINIYMKKIHYPLVRLQWKRLFSSESQDWRSLDGG